MAHRVCSYNLAFIGVAIYMAPSESDAMKPFQSLECQIALLRVGIQIPTR